VGEREREEEDDGMSSCMYMRERRARKREVEVVIVLNLIEMPAISLQLLLIEGLAEALLLATARSTRRSEKGRSQGSTALARQPAPATPPALSDTLCACSLAAGRPK